MPTDHLSPNMSPPADSSPERSEEAAAQLLAREADGILKRITRGQARQWSDWLALAEKLAGISLAAMHLSGANQRAGRAYAEMMSHLLAKHALGDAKLKQTRAALLNIWEHKAEVEAMRARWDYTQQQKWQSPVTIWDKFSHRQKADDPKQAQAAPRPSSMPGKLAELQEKLDRANRYSIADRDTAEVVLLITELFDPEQREEIITGLGANRDQPARPRHVPRHHDDDGWPLVARPTASDSEADDESDPEDDESDDEAAC